MALLLCCSAIPVWAGAEDVLGRLDLARPELAAVKTAMDAGDTQAAVAALLQHFRTRKTPKWYTETPAAPKPNPKATDPGGEKILRREYSFVGKAATLTKDLNWNANPLKDPEWPIELNRHYTWRRLVDAYHRTGNPAYAEDFVGQLRDWCADNPRPASSRQGRYTWRTLECGIRLTSPWQHCFFGMLSSPTFTPDVLCLMLETMWQQADYLTKFRGGGNWLITETSGLMTCAVLFPEFVDAPRWQKEAFARLAREIDNQVPPDGAQVELTPHYHGVTMGSFLGAARIAEYNGIAAPENVTAGILRMGRYLLNVSKPNLHAPMFNDSDDGSVARRLGPFAAADHPAMQYVLSHGKEGTAPAYTSIALPYAGQYVMRSGWDEQALYLAMDAGPYGAGHQHEDKLSVILHAYGHQILTEAGVYAYDTSDWRRYVLSTRGHNTIRVDGLDQACRRMRSEWLATEPDTHGFHSTPSFDYARDTHTAGYGKAADRGVSHRRRVLYVKPDWWLVVDDLAAGDGKAHTAASQFLINASDATVDEKTGWLLSAPAGPQNVRLLIVPLVGEGMQARLIVGQREPEVMGFLPHGFEKLRPVPAVQFELAFEGGATMAYALIPFTGDDLPLNTSVAKGRTRRELTFGDGRKVTVEITPTGLDVDCGEGQRFVAGEAALEAGGQGDHAP